MRGLSRHGMPPALACASIQGRCDLAHTLWHPNRGTFLRISAACHEGGARRRTLPHGVIHCSPNEEPQLSSCSEAMQRTMAPGVRRPEVCGILGVPPEASRLFTHRRLMAL